MYKGQSQIDYLRYNDNFSYLKNDSLVRKGTENIKFKSIAPNASSTIRVADTNRGIKVAYKIINIDSKQNSDSVAGTGP